MVELVRQGTSQRRVASKFGVSLSVVQRWMSRAGGKRLSEVDWSDVSRRPHRTRRIDNATEELVLKIRSELRTDSALGDCGAAAIRGELERRAHSILPSVRTIGRILERRGALDGKRRVRRTPPAPGWHIPDVAEARSELDSFDYVEDLKIQNGPLIDVLNAVSLHGGLVGSWPDTSTAKATVLKLLEHWTEFGLPAYAQFDNDSRFQGGHHGKDVIGRVSRTCLYLGVTPVFVPPREFGFQAAIENFNGRWQARVWSRFHHDSIQTLHARTINYLDAARRASATRIQAAPNRRVFPDNYDIDLQAYPKGKIIFIRRCTDDSTLSILGHSFPMNMSWPHRLVRCEVDFSNQSISFFALRRRAPMSQPLIREVPYTFPRKRFLE